jgi:small subunit ribosomal protein S13
MSTVTTNGSQGLSSLKKRSQSVDFRIEGVSLQNKRLCIALTAIYGIGKVTAKQICKDLQIDENIRPSEITDEQKTIIRDYIKKHLKVEGDLRKVVILNIQQKVNIQSYQGVRHRLKLPARGQRTKTNARTRKGKKSNPVANKKKVTK